jgi:hypothetical protein
MYLHLYASQYSFESLYTGQSNYLLYHGAEANSSKSKFFTVVTVLQVWAKMDDGAMAAKTTANDRIMLRGMVGRSILVKWI